MTDYEKDLDELLQDNNSSELPLPVDAMTCVLLEFNARMLAKIATRLELDAELRKCDKLCKDK